MTRDRSRFGVFPSQFIRDLVRSGGVYAPEVGIQEAQIQPASLDLRLGSTVYRLRASFLPTSGQLGKKLHSFCLHSAPLNAEGIVLEAGCIYLIPLLESLRLPENVAALSNPKSSTGRLDVFVRLLSEGGACFDRIKPGYQGPLYVEVCPQTFPIIVRRGSQLNQLRFYRGERRITREVNIAAYLGDGDQDLIGFRAKRCAGIVDIDRVAAYQSHLFWEPLYAHHHEPFVLQPGEFYILRSQQRVCVSPTEAAEMIPYDPLIGEFRAHYAGFFDPCFGYHGHTAHAVLEVRNHEMPFILDKGQTVARLIYEDLIEETQDPYGGGDAHYCGQGLKLSKHFL